MGMDVVFLFLIYKNANLVYHICKRIENEGVYFYFHIDKNSQENFECLKQLNNSHFASKRFATSWASPDLVYATYECIKDIISLHPKGHVILMSESDYPVKPIEYIKRFLADNDKNYIVTNKLPCYNPIENSNSFWIEGGMRRSKCYTFYLKPRQIATIEPKKINWGNCRQFGKVLLQKPTKIREAFELWFRDKRKNPEGIDYYGGDQWFILKIESLRMVVDYIERHPRFLTDMQYTDTPDEIFFQSLFGSLIDIEERVSTTLRFIYWPPKPSNSPNNFKLSDIDLINTAIRKSNILFVRKVQDKNVADYIDSQVKRIYKE